MNYDMVRYERGQVWMVRSKNPNNTAYGHEQQKDRPWVILSVGKFNKSSGMITAAPVTTRDRVNTPSQVMYINHNDQKNVILCEQIRGFDYTSGAYTFEYLGTLSPEVIARVNIALSVHLGLHYSPITSNVGEGIDKDTFHAQCSEPPEDCVDSPAPKVVESSEVTTPSSVEENTEESNTVPETTMQDTPKKTTRRTWSVEKCKEFLQDCDTMPMKKVMEKWGISKKPQFYVTRNYVQGKLTEMTQ